MQTDEAFEAGEGCVRRRVHLELAGSGAGPEPEISSECSNRLLLTAGVRSALRGFELLRNDAIDRAGKGGLTDPRPRNAQQLEERADTPLARDLMEWMSVSLCHLELQTQVVLAHWLGGEVTKNLDSLIAPDGPEVREVCGFFAEHRDGAVRTGADLGGLRLGSDTIGEPVGGVDALCSRRPGGDFVRG